MKFQCNKTIAHRLLVVIGLFAFSGLVTTLHAADIEKPTSTTTKELFLGDRPVDRILFLGNSITFHAPLESVSWDGNWGMAASREDLDYVHVLVHKIAEEVDGKPQFKVRNIADFERGFQAFNFAEELKEFWEFKPQLVVLAIGENVSALDSEDLQEGYENAFRNLIQQAKKSGASTIVVRSSFYPDPAKDEAMRRASEAEEVIFLDIQELSKDPLNFGRSERDFKHDGVANHPGDRGMQAIADAIWSTIQPQK
ncbi:SGNH/GDSL hydrolase family protein [Planctomicrobium sp. SH668]|uniref:SGNH/GDSL hydrolase family protein n=1 Tax=Planctomicrobium sp. SH668 TaxID=3448126 RepID=UPI003F5BCED4